MAQLKSCAKSKLRRKEVIKDMEKVVWITESDYSSIIQLDTDYGAPVGIEYQIIPDSVGAGALEDELKMSGDKLDRATHAGQRE